MKHVNDWSNNIDGCVVVYKSSLRFSEISDRTWEHWNRCRWNENEDGKSTKGPKRNVSGSLICFILFLIESLILSLHLISIPFLPCSSVVSYVFFFLAWLLTFLCCLSRPESQSQASILIEKLFSSQLST